MTITDLETYLGQVLQESFDATTTFFNITEILGYINEAFIEVALKIPSLDYLSLLKEYSGAAIAIGSSDAIVDLKVALVDGTTPDFFRLSHITMSGKRLRSIKVTDYEGLLSNNFYKPDLTEPVYYIDGTNLIVSIGIDTSLTALPFVVHYYRLPAVTTTTDIDDKFIPTIKAFVLYKAYMKNNAVTEANTYYKQYQDDITQLGKIYKGGTE